MMVSRRFLFPKNRVQAIHAELVRIHNGPCWPRDQAASMRDQRSFTGPPDTVVQAVARTIASRRHGCCNVPSFELERLHENPARARIAAARRHAVRLRL